MKIKSAVALVGVLVSVAVIGCGSGEDIPPGQTTNPPEETVMTGMPSAEGEDEFPYELKFRSEEESEEEKDGEFVYFKSAVNYPVFEGKYAENMNRFVATLTEVFRQELSAAKDNAEFDYEESQNDEYRIAMFPEEEEFVVSCPWGKGQYYTLFTKWFSYSGGAHPNTFCKAYVVDMTKGEKETLENIIRPYGLTTENIVSFATERIRNEHGEELFETDDETALEERIYEFIRGNQWYLNDKGLILFANPYDIAAYAYGMIECEISYEELEQGLKKK